MAFIRRRKANFNWSYQVIETYREGGKVRQRVLANLGNCRSIGERLAVLEAKAEETGRLLRKYERSLYRRAEIGDIPGRRSKHQRLLDEIAKLRSVTKFGFDHKHPDTTQHPRHAGSPAAQRLISDMVDGLDRLERRRRSPCSAAFPRPGRAVERPDDAIGGVGPLNCHRHPVNQADTAAFLGIGRERIGDFSQEGATVSVWNGGGERQNLVEFVIAQRERHEGWLLACSVSNDTETVSNDTPFARR